MITTASVPNPGHLDPIYPTAPATKPWNNTQVAEKVIEYLVKWTAIFLHLASCLLPKLCIINNCAFYICWCFMLCTNLLGWFPGVACIGWMTHRQMVLNARIALRTCIQHWYSCRTVCEGCEPCMDGACCLHLLFLHEELKTFTSICIAGTYCHFPLQCRRVTQSTLHSATSRACGPCFCFPPPP